MAEELILTEPDVKPEEVTTSYKVVRLSLDFKTSTYVAPPAVPSPGLVNIELESNLGAPFHHQYVGKQAMDMMKWMNTADFSTTSMQKRILQKLDQDGVLDGTIAGTPDPPPPEL